MPHGRQQPLGANEPSLHPRPTASQAIRVCSVHVFILAGGPLAIVSTLPRAPWKTAAVQPMAVLPRSLSSRNNVRTTAFGRPSVQSVALGRPLLYVLAQCELPNTEALLRSLLLRLAAWAGMVDEGGSR